MIDEETLKWLVLGLVMAGIAVGGYVFCRLEERRDSLRG